MDVSGESADLFLRKTRAKPKQESVTTPGIETSVSPSVQERKALGSATTIARASTASDMRDLSPLSVS
jgi:hypothetical protein